jgi:hypothetical protein
VYETAGKRSGYGDWSAGAGSLLKPQLLWDGVGALMKQGAKRFLTQQLTDETLTIASV